MVVVIVLLGVCGYVVMKQKFIPAVPLVDTSNWQTYTNTTYGYQIKYPKDWSIGFDNNAPAENSTTVSLNSPESLNNGQVSDITIASNLSEQNFPGDIIVKLTGYNDTMDIDVHTKNSITHTILSTFKFYTQNTAFNPYIQSVSVIQDPYGSYGNSATVYGFGFSSSTRVSFYDKGILQNIVGNILYVSSDGKTLTFGFPFDVDKTDYFIQLSNGTTTSNMVELLSKTK